MRNLVIAIPISVLGFIVVSALIFYLQQTNPTENPDAFLPCLSQKLFGIHCPGCGSTRAAHHLLNGNVARAIEMNVALVIATPFVLFGAVVLWLRWLFPHRRFWFESPLRKLPKSLPFVCLGVLILYGVLRNIPITPFTWLAPS